MYNLSLELSLYLPGLMRSAIVIAPVMESENLNKNVPMVHREIRDSAASLSMNPVISPSFHSSFK